MTTISNSCQSHDGLSNGVGAYKQMLGVPTMRATLGLLLFVWCSFDYASLEIELPVPSTDTVTVYSLARSWELGPGKAYSDTNIEDLDDLDGQGYILSRVRLDKSLDIFDLLYPLQGDDPPAICFEPRHAISYDSNRGRVTLYICFECGKTLVKIDDREQMIYHNGSRAEKVMNILNEILRAHHARVPIKQ